jgi:hypothetical protein
MLIGGLVSAAATYLIFDGVSASTLGGNFTQVVFDFKLSPALIVKGVGLALVMGLIGGLFPALRASRRKIIAGQMRAPERVRQTSPESRLTAFLLKITIWKNAPSRRPRAEGRHRRGRLTRIDAGTC